MFADDHLLICRSKTETKLAIKQVKIWCEKNNMKVNEDKSGIMDLKFRSGPSV